MEFRVLGNVISGECRYGRPGRIKSEDHSKPPVGEVFGYHPVLRTAKGTFTTTPQDSCIRERLRRQWLPRDQYHARLRAGAMPQVLQTVRRWRCGLIVRVEGQEATKALLVSVKALKADCLTRLDTLRVSASGGLSDR
jgi:hypothetical protein